MDFFTDLRRPGKASINIRDGVPARAGALIDARDSRTVQYVPEQLNRILS